jgi:hypothetical protein
MILRKLIREQIALYFESEQWLGALKVMSRGRDDVRHAHVYTDSIIHPDSIRRVVEAYFAAKGIAVERKVKLISVGRGQLVVYYIQPTGMCHFEVFPRFSKDVVLEPTQGQDTRGGSAFEYWDVDFMQNYYKQFEFAPMGSSEEEAVRDYFRSSAWEQLYAVMYYESERRVHCHALIETNLHPEEILPLGRSAIEARGWEVDRGVSVVFGVNGFEQGKLTYLVKNPEIILELEWAHIKDVTIRPAILPVARETTTDMVEKDMQGLPYIELDNDDIAWLEHRFANGTG